MNHREIDRLVEMHIFGREVKAYDQHFKHAKGKSDPIVLLGENKGFIFLPRYSEWIEDALKVIEKLREIRIFSIADAEDENGNKVYLANFQYYDGFHGINYESYHETAPLAICKAALKTVGIEIDNEVETC